MPTEKLNQVEPDQGNEFVPRPFSLTPDELGDLAVTMAKIPTSVLAWVRYPAIAVRVQGLAVAWTSRAVYIVWEDRGTHRAWVWASAVERAAAGGPPAGPSSNSNIPTTTPAGLAPASVAAAGLTAGPHQPQPPETTALGTAPLVHLVNAQLALLGAEFVSAMAKPAGPFGAVAFGSIDGHRVRLDFHVEPATGMCIVLMARTALTTSTVLMANTETEDLPERSSASTFEEAIEAYPWAAALETLELD